MKRFILLIISLFMLTSCAKGLDPSASLVADPTVIIETSKGKIEVEIFTNEVPEMAKNFMELAKAGKYDGVPFHRVIRGFMIQTGDFEKKNGTGGYAYKGPGTELAGQFAKGLSNTRGTLSFANKGPDTNGSQFFINLTDNSFLDYDKEPLSSQHPVFGKVVKGMDIVDAISKVETGANDRPKDEVLMVKVTVKEAEKR